MSIIIYTGNDNHLFYWKYFSNLYSKLKVMQQVISKESVRYNHGFLTNQPFAANSANRFFSWCGTQENSRFKWLSIALIAGMATILIVTLFVIVHLANNSFNLWVTACAIN